VGGGAPVVGPPPLNLGAVVWPDGAGLASCMGRVAEIVYFFKFAGWLDFMRGGG